MVWITAVTVAAKYLLAAYSWRGITHRFIWQYALVWIGGTACFVTLAMLILGVLRASLPMGSDHVRSLLLLMALMAVPVGRLGLAPSGLARNRHR